MASIMTSPNGSGQSMGISNPGALPMKSFFISLSRFWRMITQTLYTKKLKTMSTTTAG